MIAHSDYSWLQSTMFCQAIGDEGILPIELGINVKRLQGIEDRALAERYVAHTTSCAARASTILSKEFDELARRVRDNPELFNSTANIPTAISAHVATGQPNKLPPPNGPAGDVKEPNFQDKITGYRFEKLTHKRALIKSGTYTVNVNGKPQEYTFKIEGPEI